MGAKTANTNARNSLVPVRSERASGSLPDVSYVNDLVQRATGLIPVSIEPYYGVLSAGAIANGESFQGGTHDDELFFGNIELEVIAGIGNAPTNFFAIIKAELVFPTYTIGVGGDIEQGYVAPYFSGLLTAGLTNSIFKFRFENTFQVSWRDSGATFSLVGARARYIGYIIKF